MLDKDSWPGILIGIHGRHTPAPRPLELAHREPRPNSRPVETNPARRKPSNLKPNNKTKNDPFRPIPFKKKKTSTTPERIGGAGIPHTSNNEAPIEKKRRISDNRWRGRPTFDRKSPRRSSSAANCGRHSHRLVTFPNHQSRGGGRGEGNEWKSSTIIIIIIIITVGRAEIHKNEKIEREEKSQSSTKWRERRRDGGRGRERGGGGEGREREGGEEGRFMAFPV